jgi:predicted exporter
LTEEITRCRSQVLAWLWLGVVIALACQQVDFWRAPRIDSDVMALLPGDASDPLLAAASASIADSGTRQLAVAIGTKEWAGTRRAADAFFAHVDGNPLLRTLRPEPAELDAALQALRPHRGSLLTAAQREALSAAEPETLSRSALARLAAPGLVSGLTGWREDPLGLWPEWWQARAGSGFQTRDGLLARERDGWHWALLRFESAAPAFRLDGERRLQDLLDAASAAARAASPDPALRVLRGGVPLHAEAAAVQANREVGTIGLGSLAAVLLLVWLAFRGVRPIVLIAGSLLIGCAAGVAVTVLIFGKVHLLTLIFGASLVGVAEDYGIHYFASRQGHPQVPSRTLMQSLLPGMALALATSVLAYLALGIAPFPGLRQMAVFCATGLVAAFATVVLWFPMLDRAAPASSGFGRWIAATLRPWPRLHGARGALIVVLLAALALVGASRLQPDDSLRSLQGSSASMLAEQIEIGGLADLPSPAQFFLVEGSDEQELLRHEEALTARLRTAVAAGQLAGWQALSDWVPSIAQQSADAALTARVEQRALQDAATLLDEPVPQAEPPLIPLAPAVWLAQPLAAPLRPLWLGRIGARHASVVLVNGATVADLEALRGAAAGLDGVRWVDRTEKISRLLQHYRAMMTWLLLLGYIAVGFALWLRYRRAAWRALLPTLLAALLTLAALAVLGEPLQLFAVLAQLLLLGIGVDYGIFLLEHRDDPSSWLAVSVGAASTWLAFGLLGLSATPALRSFGLTLLFGVALVWLLSPLFRAATTAARAPQ